MKITIYNKIKKPSQYISDGARRITSSIIIFFVLISVLLPYGIFTLNKNEASAAEQWYYKFYTYDNALGSGPYQTVKSNPYFKTSEECASALKIAINNYNTYPKIFAKKPSACSLETTQTTKDPYNETNYTPANKEDGWYYTIFIKAGTADAPKAVTSKKSRVQSTLEICNYYRDIFIKDVFNINKDYYAGAPTVCKTDKTTESYNNPDPTGTSTGASEVTQVDPKTINLAASNSTVYKLLAPIPGIGKCIDTNTSTAESNGCLPGGIGDYLGIIFKIGIGLAAALAVVMLIIYGVVYMGDESVFGKTEAKSKMISAIFGLLIALGAYALLNTINPALTGKGGLNVDSVNIVLEDFPVSGSATFDGKPINIKFETEAYPAAKIASGKTGVDTAFILAMFAQETGSGSNTGKCNYMTANMGSGQLEALKSIASKLKLDYTKINMSCSGGGSTHGGAIGYTQFLPGTWQQYASQAKSLLGHEPYPWDPADALMMTALFLKGNGGSGNNSANQERAACAYFGSCSQKISCGSGKTGTYGQCILGKKISIQQQIDAAIKAGKLKK